MKKIFARKKRPKNAMGGLCLHSSFGVVMRLLDKMIVLWMQALYKIHIRIRGVHDQAYKNIKPYKNWTDKPYSSAIHKTVFTTFVVTLVFIQGLQLFFPYLNVWKPNTAQAGASAETWTTSGDFNSNQNTTGTATTLDGVAAGNEVELASAMNPVTDIGSYKSVLDIDKQTGTTYKEAYNNFFKDGDYVYISGYINDGNTCRVEKRNFSDYSYVTSFNTVGYIDINNNGTNYLNSCTQMVQDQDYLYIASASTNASITERYVTLLKISKATGSLDLGFGSNGWLVIDLATGTTAETPQALIEYGGSLYVTMFRNAGAFYLRKYATTNGSQQAATTSSATGISVTTIAQDGTNLYIGGYDSVPGNLQWRTEKRAMSNLALVTAFDSDGILQTNPSTATDGVNSIAYDNGYVYLLGYSNTTSTVGIEKRNSTNGTLETAFAGDGSYTEYNAEPLKILISGDRLLYTATSYFGSEYTPTLTNISKVTSSIVGGFSAEADYATGTNKDRPVDLFVDGNYAHILNMKSSPSVYSTNIFRVRMSDGYIEKDGTYLSDTSSSQIVDVIADDTRFYIAKLNSNFVTYTWQVKRVTRSNFGIDYDFNGGSPFQKTVSSSDTLNRMIADGSSLYLVGKIANKGSIVKVNKFDGLIDESFGTSGQVDSNYSTLNEIYDIKISGDYIYTVGYTGVVGNYESLIEKRNKNTGLLETSFGTNGYLRINQGSGNDWFKSLVIIDDYMIVAGCDSINVNTQIRLEKRLLSSGNLVTTFGNNGIILENPSGGTDSSIKLLNEGDNFYLLAQDYALGVNQVRIEKRSLVDGSLNTAFSGDGIYTNYSGSGSDYIYNAKIVSDSLYVTGSQSGTTASVQKVFLSTGLLDESFGSSGKLQLFGTGSYALDFYSGRLYLAHYTSLDNRVTVLSPTYEVLGTISALRFDSGIKAKWSALSWNSVALPANTSISFKARTSDDSVTWSGWSSDIIQDVDGTTTGTGSLSALATSRYLDITMTLISSDGVNTPTLNDFTVSYDTLEAPANSLTTIYKSNYDGTNGATTKLKTSTGIYNEAGEPNGYTSEATVKLNNPALSCTDCGGTLTGRKIEVQYSPVNTAFVDETTNLFVGDSIDNGDSTFSSTATLTGLLSGSYHLRMRTKDDAGRISAWQSYGGNTDTIEADIAIDQTVPTGTIQINSEAIYTTSAVITLSLSATDFGGSELDSIPQQMRFSNDGTNWGTSYDPDTQEYSGDWDTYNTTKAWTLSSDDGDKKVYVQYRDNAGNMSGDSLNRSLTAVADTHISAYYPTDNYGTLVGQLHVRSDDPISADFRQRPLLRFNLSEFVGAQSISNADLSVYANFSLNNESVGRTYAVHPLTSFDWVETQATWIQKYSGTNWDLAGSDFDNSMSALAVVPVLPNWQTWSIEDIVINNITSGGEYLDLVVVDNQEMSHAEYTRYNSRESASNKPTLSISAIVPYSASITLDTTPPASVTGLTGYASDGGAQLVEANWYDNKTPYFDWADNTDTDLNHYEYCIGTSTCTPSITTGTTSNVTLNLNDEQTYPDGTYYVRVVAVDEADNPSTIPVSWTFKLDRSTPAPVTGYSASQNQDDVINISWVALGNLNGSPITYSIERIKYVKFQEGFTVDDIEPDKVWSDQTDDGYTIYTGITGTGTITYPEAISAPERGIKFVYRIRATDATGKSGDYQNDPFYGLTRDGIVPTTPVISSVTACSYQNEAACSDSENDLLKGHEVKVSWTEAFDEGTGVQKYYVIKVSSILDDTYATEDIVSTFIVDHENPLQSLVAHVTTDIDDYTYYHYRVIAEDGSTPPNKSSFMPSSDENYGYVRTPDVTPPEAPVASAAAGGLDSSFTMQKVVIGWNTPVELGAGIKTYTLYRADRVGDVSDESGTLTDGDFINITSDPDVTCNMGARECTEESLGDNRYYYYRVKATDNDPYNNVSDFSATATVQTYSSAVPSPPRGRKDLETQVYEQYPYTLTTKGDPNVDGSVVGHQAKVTFTGSYLKDSLPYLVNYQVYRSTDNTNYTLLTNFSYRYYENSTWSSSTTASTVTPRRVDDDRDATYEITDATVLDATKYYYKIKANGNNPDVPAEQNFTYSSIGANVNQGWDVTPDATAPDVVADDLGLSVKDTYPTASIVRNIISWKIIEPSLRRKMSFETCDVIETIGGVDYCSDFARYEIHREIYDENDVQLPPIGGTTKVADITDIGTNVYIDSVDITYQSDKFKYYIIVVDNADTEFVYQTGTPINAYANYTGKFYWNGSITPDKSHAVISGYTLTGVNVTSATVSWNTDQETDSLVEYRPMKIENGNWTVDTSHEFTAIGHRESSKTHSVYIFGLQPNTRYEYRLVSKNYPFANETVVSAGLPTLVTTGFNITPGSVITTTTNATLYWTTNLDAKSAFVEYQLQRQPGDDPQGGSAGVDPTVIISSPKNHSVVIKGLRSNRTYSYKIKSISTDDYLTEHPIESFGTFRTQSFDSAQFTLTPASSNVAERNITATTAQIVWQTADDTTSWVDYSTTSGIYDNAAGNNDLVTQHVVVIEGLIPGTTYYYRVRVKDANEVEFTSQEYSFKAVLKPKISNMTVKDITPYSVTIAWDTNVDTETIINWGTTTAYGEKRGKSGVSKVHELTIDNLLDNQEYHYQILAKDEAGNEVADTDKIVRTPLDTEGPKITGVKIDVLPMGENDNTASVIVSWQTNKPATTLVEYDEGVIGGTYGKRSVEDTSLNNSHTVIIKDLVPASSYHYRLVSSDKRSNKTVSQDYTFVTPSKEKSILQLIIKSLEETFSWTRNLNQFFTNIGKRISGK